MNPARTFGPSLVNGSWTHYAWVYYLGQLLGSVLATLTCQLPSFPSSPHTRTDRSPRVVSADVLLKTLDYDKVVGEIETADVDQSAGLEEAPVMNLASNLANVMGRNTNADKEDSASECEKGLGEGTSAQRQLALTESEGGEQPHLAPSRSSSVARIV